MNVAGPTGKLMGDICCDFEVETSYIDADT